MNFAGSQRTSGVAIAMSRITAGAALILVATFVVYIPAMSAGFIWDDDQLLTQNPQVHDSAGIWKAWVAPTTADYLPLTTSVLWLEFRLGNTFDVWNVGYLNRHADTRTVNGYHVVNILLHGIAAVLMWQALRALHVPGAWLAALLFAVHPVCVESVAWIAELKNTLSLLFFVLTLLAYLGFERHPRPMLYICAIGCFCLSLAAKPSVAPLPAVLLLLAWWQRGTISRHDLLRSIPFGGVSLVAGIVTIYFQSHRAIGAESIAIGSLPTRIALAGMAVWFYLSKAIWPGHLIPVYPAWNISPPPWYGFLPLAGLIAIVAACWRRRVQTWAQAVLLALGYYTIMLLPVLGLIKISYMRLTLVADHFQYLALIGVIALAVAAARCWLPRPTRVPTAAVTILILCRLSWTQASFYRNEETLWTETLKRNPDMWQAHNHLGLALLKHTDPASQAEALAHFQRAVALKPDNPEAHNNLAISYAAHGQTNLAIDEYTKAIRIKDDPAIRTNLGIALCAQRRFAEAEPQYRRALAMDPSNAARYSNLGYVLVQLGRIEEAREQFRRALELDPNLPQARQSLRALSNQQGR